MAPPNPARNPPPASPPAVLLLAAIVDSSDDAIVSKSLDGIITSWNASAERMFGYTAAEAIGHPVLMLVPPDRQDEEPKILQRLRRGERVEHFETIRLRKSGGLFPVSLTISPVKDHHGTIVGASKIARDITELHRITQERQVLLELERTARAQAEKANRMKDEFLSTVSHELRTPLNAIIGWTEVLKDSGGHSPETLQGIEVIERNARVQAKLIEDLLDLGRISSGKMTIDPELLEIGAVVQEAITAVRHAAEARRIRIALTLGDGRQGVTGDKRRIQQVLWNLLSNAIKFTPEGGKAAVAVTRRGGTVEIAVTDNGRGIAPDFLPHVFERFRQADSSTTRQYGGLGIGLAIVQQLVDLHGGTVRAESAGLGQGATFTVSLPAATVRIEASRPAHPPAASARERERTEELAGLKVLVIDDDLDSLDVMERILSNRRAEVKIVSSAEAALEAFPNFRPHIVLSDIGMPGLDGYELIRRLRQLPGGATVPAAALTALARSEDRTRALEAGFQTHVAKPLVPAELIAIVRSLATLQTGGWPRYNAMLAAAAGQGTVNVTGS